MSLLQAMGDIPGFRVVFISSASSGIPTQENKFKEYIIPPPSLGSTIGKALQYAQFRFFALRKLHAEAQPSDIIWLGSLDTALTLKGSKALERTPYILQLHELYDTHPKRLKMVTPIAQNALRVVTPEENRAAILQVWLKLKDRPTVIPNKPYTHPRQRFLPPSTPKTKEIIEKLWNTDKTVILYQGHIGGDRNLMPLAEAMRDLPDMELWLMGQDHGYAGALTDISANIKYLGYVPAPYHLEITSYASIGIMSYDPINLNNLYCAPNKIWEYSGFCIPFISNNSPSLSAIAEKHNSGICTELSKNELKISITKIKENIEKYFNNSKSQFESFCFSEKLNEVIADSKEKQKEQKNAINCAD